MVDLVFLFLKLFLSIHQTISLFLDNCSFNRIDFQFFLAIKKQLKVQKKQQLFNENRSKNYHFQKDLVDIHDFLFHYQQKFQKVNRKKRFFSPVEKNLQNGL